MAKELFSSTDADGSGAIDQKELSAALAAKSKNGQGPDAAELFSTLHKDLAQASMLTTAELGQGMAAMSGAGEAGQQTGSGLAQTLLSSKFEAYRLMGMDAQAYLSGSGFSATA